MATIRRTVKPSMRPKTLRASVAPSYSSLHSELVMHLHQKERLQQELHNLRARHSCINSTLEKLEDRIRALRARARSLEEAADAESEQSVQEEPESKHPRKETSKQTGENKFKQMTLRY